MILTKDAFSQGKKDGLLGFSQRQAEAHCDAYPADKKSNYINGYIYGRRERSRARIMQQKIWNLKGVCSTGF